LEEKKKKLEPFPKDIDQERWDEIVTQWEEEEIEIESISEPLLGGRELSPEERQKKPKLRYKPEGKPPKPLEELIKEAQAEPEKKPTPHKIEPQRPKKPKEEEEEEEKPEVERALSEITKGVYEARVAPIPRKSPLPKISEEPWFGPEPEPPPRLVMDKDKWTNLMKVFAEEAKLNLEAKKSAQLYYEAGRIAQLHLNNKELALDYYLTAFNRDETFLLNLKELRSLLLEKKEFKQVIEIINQELKGELSQEEQIELLHLKAKLLLYYIKDIKEAFRCYEEILKIQKGDPRALLSFADLASFFGKDQEAAEAMKRLGMFWRDGSMKAISFYFAARHQENKGEIRSALENYQKVLDILPDEKNILYRLERLFFKTKDWNNYLKVLEQIEKKGEGEEKKAAQIKQAKLLWTKLSKPKEAIRLLKELPPSPIKGALLSTLLRELQQEDELIQVLSEISSIFEKGPRQASADEEIIKILESKGKKSEAITLLSQALKKESKFLPLELRLSHIWQKNKENLDLLEFFSSKEVKDKFLYHLRRARTFEFKLKEIEKALKEYEQIKALGIYKEFSDIKINFLLKKLSRWEQVVQFLEASGVKERIYQAGLIREFHLNDPEGARRNYERIQSEDPRFFPAWQAEERLLLSHKIEGDIAEFYQRWANSAEPPLNKALLRQSAIFKEKITEDSNEVILLLEPLLDTVLTLDSVFRELELSYLMTNNIERLAKLYQKILENKDLSSEELIKLHSRIGYILTKKYERQGISHLKSALELLKEDQVISFILKDIYIYQREFDSLARVFYEEGVKEGDRSSFLYMAGQLWSRARVWNKAEKCFQEALEKDPSAKFILYALERMYTLQGKWESLTDLYLKSLKQASSTEEKVRLYESLARLDEFKREDIASAILGYNSILEICPSSLPSLFRLRRHFLAQARQEELIPILKAIGRYTDDPLLSTFSYISSAEFLKQKGKEEELNELYKEALLKGPESQEALYEIESYGRKIKDVEILEQVFERLSKISFERERPIYLTRCAEIKVQKGEIERALELLNEAISIQRDYVPALILLGQIYIFSEKWELSYEIMERLANLHKCSELKVRYMLEAGIIAEERFNDLDLAVKRYLDVLAVDLSCNEAFLRVSRILESKSEYRRLSDLFKRRLKLEENLAKKAELSFQISQLLLKLKEKAEAKEFLRQSLEFSSEYIPTLRLLGDILYEDQEWSEAKEVYLRLVNLLKDKAELSEALFKLGMILSQLEDLDRAQKVFSKLISLNPDHIEAMVKLSRIYLSKKEWEKAQQVIIQLCQKDKDSKRRSSYFITLSRIYEEGMNNIKQAEKALNTASRLDPRGKEAIKALTEFYDRHKMYDTKAIYLDHVISDLRAELITDPFNIRLYQDLVEVFIGRRNLDAAGLAAEIVEVFGSLDESLKSSILGKGRALSIGPWVGDPSLDELLSPPLITVAFREVFRYMGDFLKKLFDIDYSRFGISKKDKISLKRHPLGNLAREVGLWYGVNNFEIYLSHSRPEIFGLLITSPPSIVLGVGLITSSKEELRFFLGKAFKLIQLRLDLPFYLGFKLTAQLIGAIGRYYDPKYKVHEADERGVQRLSSLIGKVIPKRLRRQIMPFAIECSRDWRLDFTALAEALETLADRAGLICAGKISSAISALRKSEGILSPFKTKEELFQSVKNISKIGRLMLFSVSDTYFEIRKLLEELETKQPKFI
jgi:tetratricopeptide (TPR) repeat protein